MFSPDVLNRLKEEFGSLKDSVRLILYSDGSQLSAETEELLKAVVSLSDKLSLQVKEKNGCPGYPCILFLKGDRDTGIRFMGKPDGGEFTPFIKTILMVSRGEHGLSDRTVRFLEEIDKPVDIKVFITKSCGWCPPMMLKLFGFALASSHITATAIDSFAFPELANRYKVATVPKTVINDKVEIIGYREENEILGHIIGAVE
ncbi:MAG: glutaredoxin [Aquificae bacterium]|nr:glutaredoxin [Aquificota bacterium]